MLQLLYLPFLMGLLLVYFRIAEKFNIIDKPNERSSHKNITIRGGGIIFPIAFFIHFVLSRFEYPYFTIGLLIISLVSFIDDIKPLSNKVRIVAHLVSVSLLFYQADLPHSQLWIIVLAYILVIGTINAYNFMDGINGITGVYSLITIGSLWYVNENQIQTIGPRWFSLAFIALVVFSFFNFRKRAKCFLGDVGSVGIAFTIIFFILLLILQTNDLKYIAFLLLYGLDSVSTIVLRLFRGENIFVAHRSHFYQYLANTREWPHLAVSLLYALTQLALNTFIIFSSLDFVQLFLFILGTAVLFVGTRYLTEGNSLFSYKPK